LQKFTKAEDQPPCGPLSEVNSQIFSPYLETLILDETLKRKANVELNHTAFDSLVLIQQLVLILSRNFTKESYFGGFVDTFFCFLLKKVEFSSSFHHLHASLVQIGDDPEYKMNLFWDKICFMIYQFGLRI
jgi:hypothetical protein